MNTHDNIEELADLATAGAWEPDAHATSCGTCTAAIADARAFQRWTSGLLGPDAPPADLEERLIKAFRSTDTAAARRFRRLPGKRVLTWAAAAAALVGIVALGGSFARPEAESLQETAAVAEDFDGYLGLNRDRFHWAESDGKRQVHVDNLSDGLVHDFVPPTARGAAPLTGAAFSLDLGLVNTGKAQRVDRLARNGVEKETLLTRMEADAQVFTRQAEVQLAQIQELTKNVEEYRGKLGKSMAEKSTAVAELQYARQQGERLSQDLASLEEKVVERSRGEKTLEEKLNAVALSGGVGGASTAAVFFTEAGRPVQDHRKLIRTAKLALEVEGYEAAQTKVAAAAAEEKGYVASADTERLQNGKIRATVTLRVPPDRFEALLGKLRALGTVKHQTLATDDVGKSYFDMEARMGAKQALLDRLKKVLAEAKGSVKELMDVEVQMGATLEQIEALKGELKYLDGQVSLATITLQLAEKDLGQPFEYVQTLQSRIGLVTSDVDAAYAAAQKAVVDAGGQVVDSKLTRQNDGAATGTVRARVEAAKFPDVRQALRALGHVETDTVDQQKSARGGAPTAFAPVRVEQATIDLSVSTPALLVSRKALIVVETKGVEAAYQAARKAVEAAGGRVLDGGLSNSTAGGAASLTVQVDVAKFAELVELFRASGEVKHAVVNQSAGVLAVPLRERGEIVLQLKSPPALIGEEQGLGRIVRDTFSRSWAGLLWSVEKLFVGLSLAGPWALAVVAGWLLWRRARRRKASAAQ